MDEMWLIVGISGVTCAGKTTLATELNKIIPNSKILSQDDYFLEVDDPRHIWIPELNHINFDILSSLDMEKMYKDILNIIGNTDPPQICKYSEIFCASEATQNDVQKMFLNTLVTKNYKLLIVEGFSILNYKPIEAICNFKYYLTLNEQECVKRRNGRVYEPPDCTGYFEFCVWPEYLKQLEDVQKNGRNVKFLNEFTKAPLKSILIDILGHL